MNNITDLQNWHTGLPAAANWNVVGYNTNWHVAQVQAGHRLLPSIFTPLNGASTGWNTSNNTDTINAYLTNFRTNIQWLSQNNVPLCLRTNNIVDMFISSKYQLPIDPLNIPNSIFVWANNNGVYSQLNLVDSFADPTFFANEGNDLGQSLFMATLNQYYPNPPWFIYIENNEGSYDDYGRYCLQSNTDSFIPINLICTQNVRASDFILANPGILPSQFGVTFFNNRKAQYQAFYNGFNNGLPTGWQNKMTTAGYAASLFGNGALLARFPPPTMTGYAPESLSYNTGSKSVYIDPSYGDFTALKHTEFMNQIVSWKWLEKNTANHYRELSLKLTRNAVMVGAQANKHLVISPAHYEGYLQFVLWCMRDIGKPVLLRHWTSSTTKPTDPFFNPSDLPFLRSQGLSTAFQNLTEGDYFQAVMTAVDRVCEDSTLRSFWLNGTPYVNPVRTPTDIYLNKLHYPPLPQGTDEGNYFRLLNVDVNTPAANWAWDGNTNSISGTIKVWAVATIYNGQALVFAWSPCFLISNITISVPGILTATVAPPQPWAYYLFTSSGAIQLPLSTSLMSSILSSPPPVVSTGGGGTTIISGGGTTTTTGGGTTPTSGGGTTVVDSGGSTVTIITTTNSSGTSNSSSNNTLDEFPCVSCDACKGNLSEWIDIPPFAEPEPLHKTTVVSRLTR